MTEPNELLQGTVDLLILKAVSLEPMHGWGISPAHPADHARRARGESGRALSGAPPPRGPRLARRRVGHVGEQSAREVLPLTAAGRHQLAAETRTWQRYATAVQLLLRAV